jgi:hypothetical protein
MSQPPSFLGNLTGVSFRPADVKEFIYEELQPGQRLTLKRDPFNAHDENAVQVFLERKRNPTIEEWYGYEAMVLDEAEEGKRLTTTVDEELFLSYVERGVAAPLAKWMDEGYEFEAFTKSRIQHKMTPWLLEIKPTGNRVEPTLSASLPGLSSDDDIPF